MKKGAVLVLLIGLIAIGVAAQAYNPVVHMNITLPDGQTKALSAPESGLATTTLTDGTEIGFRPTIVDDKPWNHIIVAIFKMPTQTHASEELGLVDLKTGGEAVASKTTPSFKIAVSSVTPPEGMKKQSE